VRHSSSVGCGGGRPNRKSTAAGLHARGGSVPSHPPLGQSLSITWLDASDCRAVSRNHNGCRVAAKTHGKGNSRHGGVVVAGRGTTEDIAGISKLCCQLCEDRVHHPGGCTNPSGKGSVCVRWNASVMSRLRRCPLPGTPAWLCEHGWLRNQADECEVA
jgi:hypothetical protein